MPKSSSSGQPSTSLVPKVSDKSVKSDKEPSERVSEERFCTIVQSDNLRKIRIIANREGLQIKEVVNAAFEKAIKSYERRKGPVDGRMKGDAKNLFWLHTPKSYMINGRLNVTACRFFCV